MDRESQYFQSIASCFFTQRGAPFYLSSREFEIVASWEKSGIPLRVVLEGINNAFEAYRMRPGRKGKILTLSFCHDHVLKAYELHKERKLGKRRRISSRSRKEKKIAGEIERFLKTIPDHLRGLESIYRSAQNVISRRVPVEDELERMEKEVEEFLVKHATSEENEHVRNEVREDHHLKSGEDFNRIFRIELVKHIRNKHKIPYISPMYY